MATRRTMLIYAGWMGLLTVAFYLFPQPHLVTWTAVGLSSAAAVVVGIRRNRPRRSWPWIMIMVGILMLWAGDAWYNILTEVLDQPNPYPSFADVLYLAMFVFIGVGVWGLASTGAASYGRVAALDGLILIAVVGLPWWLFLIGPHTVNPDLSTLQRLVSIAYPVGDILILVIVARLVALVRFSRTVQMLALGAISLLVTDVIYGLIQLYGKWAVGGPVDIGWLIFYSLWGAAALHPSMVELTEPRVVRPRPPTRRRQALLGVALLVPGAILAVELVRKEGNAALIAGFSVVIGLLVLLRLIVSINGVRRDAARTGAIADASAALVSATDVAGVTSTLHSAAVHLAGPGGELRLLVVMNDGDTPGLFNGVPVDGGRSSLGNGIRDTRIQYTWALPAQIAAQLPGEEVTMVLPLALNERPIGDPYLGVLLIAADEVVLGRLQEPMEVLASQAALAIERITLSREIIRRDSERYFRTLVRNTTDVVLIVEPGADVIRYASPSARTVFGTDELTGQCLRDLVDSKHALPAAQLRELAVAEPGTTVDWSVHRADDSVVQIEASCRDLTHDPTVGGMVVTLRDVTSQRRLEEQLTHRANYDALTGLANRVLLQERLQEATERAERTGTTAGVLFIDLDDFKVINDTLGHAYGDSLLQAVSQRLVKALRPQDTAARLGGDEFAALIEDAPGPSVVDDVAARVVTALAEPFMIGEHALSAIASIGVATTTGSVDGQDLLRHADLALYAAKAAGKGQWRRYQDDLQAAVVRRLELRTALDQALVDGGFVLDYQPIVHLPTATTVGFEALIRWNHPTRGLLLPGEFIDVAEESGQIVAMGHWILTEAIAAAARWQDLNPTVGPYVSVNVSARQFRTPGFLHNVRQALIDGRLPPGKLMIEITESLLLRDDEQVWDDLAELRSIGIRIAIDDFGTGYSSLSYLRHVPLDVLKIDRVFTRTIATSTRQSALVDSIVQLSHTLGLRVIAEGIETPQERDLLTRIGCHYGQGFLLSRPLSLEATTQWLTARQATAAHAPRG